MPLYKHTFERTNFGVTPPLKQSADVLLQTTIPFDDANIDAFEEAFWAAAYKQNPHWQDSAGPLGSPMGWSSVMTKGPIVCLDALSNLSFAWYIPAEAWLKADGASTTEDIEDAGRFSPEELIELQQRYPGERYSMVMANLVSAYFDKDGTPLHMPDFHLRYDDFVLWGYGPDATTARAALAVSRINLVSTGRFEYPFELPESNNSPEHAPQEYSRCRSWGWRFGQDGSWKLAASREEALIAAKKEALCNMRETGYHNCGEWLALKYNCKEVVIADNQRHN